MVTSIQAEVSVPTAKLKATSLVCRRTRSGGGAGADMLRLFLPIGDGGGGALKSVPKTKQQKEQMHK